MRSKDVRRGSLGGDWGRLGLARLPRGGPMAAEHRFCSYPRNLALIAVATTALAFGASPSLAATGRVYVYAGHNVGAGHDFFGGTTPANDNNVGLGYSVMPNLTTASDNTGVGADALAANTTGDANVATGSSALASNTTGDRNLASGAVALEFNTTGSDNVASGEGALTSNTTAS